MAVSLADRLTRHPAYKTYITNPVVVRDLRAQMRGTKSFWYQGAFLLLLGILAVTGYASATGQGIESLGGNAATPVSIVDAQWRLQGFYSFIFGTLAALTILIAPALTAASIVGERQRLSFDLLVTTPLSAGQMLLGKLISSTAFLLLLLSLSLPAAALCVLLGGATVGDLLRSYFLLVVGGLVLSAIGLYFSCAVRTPLLAIVWTYGVVAVYLYATGGLFWWLGGNLRVDGATQANWAMVCGALNPLAVVGNGNGIEGSVRLFGSVSVPLWLATTVVGVFVLRLLLTAAEYRLGVYGAGSVRSLRRQLLFVATSVTFCLIYERARGTRAVDFDAQVMVGASHMLTMGMAILFLASIPFLVNLFVPASAEDAPPGVAENAVPEGVAGYYKLSAAFRPDPAGALPYFHLLFGAIVTAGILALTIAVRALTFAPGRLAIGIAYVAAMGFLLWAISRTAARWVSGLATARAVAFGTFAAIVAVPMMITVFLPGGWNSPFLYAWILRPVTLNYSDAHALSALKSIVAAGGLSLVLGLLFFAMERRMARKIG